jgi:hypothetical protein
MRQFRHARNLLSSIDDHRIVAFAAGFSPAEAKHDGWATPVSTAGGIWASIRAGTSTVWKIRVGTWAGISTHGRITAGIEVPCLGVAEAYTCGYRN